MKRGFLSHWS